MVRNKNNFLNSFWMKTDRDSVRYCRIRIWNRIEKINENRIRMYPLYYHIKFEYGYKYPYWYLNGYRYWIIRISAIRLPSLGTRPPVFMWLHVFASLKFQIILVRTVRCDSGGFRKQRTRGSAARVLFEDYSNGGASVSQKLWPPRYCCWLWSRN